MEAVQEPSEVTVSPDHFAIASGTCDFVVPVLEQEHALLLVQRLNGDDLLWSGGCNARGKISTSSCWILSAISVTSGRFSKPTTPRISKRFARACIVPSPAGIATDRVP